MADLRTNMVKYQFFRMGKVVFSFECAKTDGFAWCDAIRKLYDLHYDYFTVCPVFNIDQTIAF